MKKLPAILGLLLLICIFFPGCEVENCPPTHVVCIFSLVDQHGRSFNTSDTITIVDRHADIVVYDTPARRKPPAPVPYRIHIVSDTLINWKRVPWTEPRSATALIHGLSLSIAVGKTVMLVLIPSISNTEHPAFHQPGLSSPLS